MYAKGSGVSGCTDTLITVRMNAMAYVRLALVVLLMVLLSACNLAQIAAPTITPYPTPQPIAPDGSTANVFPSITPLAPAVVTTQTVYITATPIPGFGAQTVYVTATPFGSGGGLSMAVTPGTANPTLAPAPPSTNVIDSLINNVAIPAWNFLYTLVLSGIASLWNFAGARGGLFAQGLCCLLPAVILSVLAVRAAISRRRWPL